MRLWSIVPVAVLALLGGCASRPEPLAVVPPPVVATLTPPAAVVPVLSPINADLTPAATMWHLRAALNVAALACRGPDEAVIVAGYNALLARHRVTLAAAEHAYAAEFGAGAAARDAYDDAMTRLYNFFSQAPARAPFCAAAAATLADGAALEDDALAGFATERLALLDRPFAAPAMPAMPPVPAMTIAVTAPVTVAARPVRPRLELDPSVFRDDAAVAH